MTPMKSRRLFLLGAAALLAGCAATPTRESTGEYIDDSAITTKVKSALLGAKDVEGTAIKVETFRGVVQLSGFVRTGAERERAAEIARSVKGVKGVTNDVIVK